MSRICIAVSLFVSVSFFPLDCKAGEFSWKLHLGDEVPVNGVYYGIEVTDSEYLFKVKDIQCGVTQTKVHKDKKFGDLVSRSLYCLPQKDIEVSILVQCSDDNSQGQSQLVIKMPNKAYIASLFCYPKEMLVPEYKLLSANQ